jgi:hypothetical protein
MIRVKSTWSISKSIRSIFNYQAFASFSSDKGSSSQNKGINGKEHYIHNVNYNFEQYKKYTRELNQALQESKAEEELEVKINKEGINKLPRRKRRIYDRPKHDLNIENYHVWRNFDKPMMKIHPHGFPVVCKIPIAPAKLIKVSIQYIF